MVRDVQEKANGENTAGRCQEGRGGEGRDSLGSVTAIQGQDGGAGRQRGPCGLGQGVGSKAMKY